MDDLISRQAAIDAIESHLRTAEEPYYLHDTDKIMNHAFEVAASCVYNLPSEQPEIVRCKDCKYYTSVTAQCEIRGKGLHLIRGLDDFCSRAERRPDE